MLGTRTLHKGGVMIRWLGLLGRCVGASYHAGFCCGCAVYSGCVLGTFDCVQLQFTLYYHDVAVVMIVILPLCLLSVSRVRIDPVGSHAPHHLVSKLAVSPRSSLLGGAPCRPTRQGSAEV